MKQNKINQDNAIISIIVATTSKKRITTFLTALNTCSSSPKNIEAIILLDANEHTLEKDILQLLTQFSINIKCVKYEHPMGYFSLQYGYNHIFHHHLDPNSYFISVWSDTIQPSIKTWDKELLSYVKSFDDDVFRVCISHSRGLKNPNNLKTQMMNPENFGFYTTQYIKNLGGLGPLWGIDSWLEVCVNIACLLDPSYHKRTIYNDTISIAPYGYDDRSARDAAMINWSFTELTVSPIFISIAYNHAYQCVHGDQRKMLQNPYNINNLFYKDPKTKHFAISTQQFSFSIMVLLGGNFKLLQRALKFLFKLKIFPKKIIVILAKLMQTNIVMSESYNYIDQMIVHQYYFTTLQDKQWIHANKK